MAPSGTLGIAKPRYEFSSHSCALEHRSSNARWRVGAVFQATGLRRPEGLVDRA
jgi:hypothetical protein